MHWTPEGLSQPETYYNYPLGCGVLYWPGRDRLLESVRLENIRDGIEDWMVLRMLQERLSEEEEHPQPTRQWIKQARIALRLRDALVSDRVRSDEVFDHNADPMVFKEVRTAVGDALAAAPRRSRGDGP